MPLQNRVSPYGEIVATASRGMWMGNRGCLHGPDARLTVKRWVRPQWVICSLSYNNRHREVMAPGKYTELFFLDEATALAAGHRPCGTCRKPAYMDFLATWRSFEDCQEIRLSELDAKLHSQRAAVIGHDALPVTDISTIPDGCLVALEPGGEAYLVYQDRLYHWSFEGYAAGPRIAKNISVVLITPSITKEIIALGYSPQIHASVTENLVIPSGVQKPKPEQKVEHVAQRSHSQAASVQAGSAASSVVGKSLYKLNETPRGRELSSYFAAILQITGMDQRKSFPLKKFLKNFSGHEAAGRISSAGSGHFVLSKEGVKYFQDRFQSGNPHHVTQAEVDRYKQCILKGGGAGWSTIA